MPSPNFKFSQPAELDITIVIVSFNTRGILIRCLESIKKHTQEISYEVIVVDNAHVSSDEHVDGETWCKNFFGSSTTWKQTSYNNNFRKQNYSRV